MDRYESDGIDDNEQNIITFEQRRLAEKQNEMERRLMNHGARHRQAAAFENMSEEDSQMQGVAHFGGQDYDDGVDVIQQVNDYGDMKGESLAAWIAKEDVTLYVRRKFSNFLRQYTDENDLHIYESRI
jgi:hypothetical protein